ncbi:MAG: Ig-like domain-containing protein [Bacteroidales bacterium]|nr:Ig-like domain-containing protein [Bacteroidales bacterium]MBN2762688.1 Ig-like domain-containing protein [Bacteroidales bacterium]
MKWISAFFCFSLFTSFAFSQTPIIADHTVATLSDLQNIPETYINAAKANLHIAYEHASHGSQITEGMTGLYAWKGSTYAFAKGGGNGVLDYRDHDIDGWADLGNMWDPDEVDFEAWEGVTRTYLAENPDISVIMWSWCTELSYDATPDDVNTYLSLMSGLEEDYPNVKFIYQTGHVDGRPPNTNLYIHNAMIRNYCIANNKILFDFGDIESYDPDGNFYADKRVTDCCNYDYDGSGETETDGGDPGLPTGGDRNWALDWQASHTQNVDWYDCEASHTYPLNANMKAYAAWWLWARLAGWDGSTTTIPVTDITVTGAGGASAITTDNGTLQLSAAVLPANATNKTVRWSVTNGTGQATISSTGLVTAVADGTVTAKATANDGSGVTGTLTITISNQNIHVTNITVTGAGGASTITTDNGTLQLSAAVLPSNATNKTVTWSITNGTGQATISSTGLVTAVASGTVTAKATANDGSGVTGMLTITISNQIIPVTSITVSGEGGETTITTYNGTLQLSAAVLPFDATNKTVTWSITNGTGEATINSSGLVTAVTNGTVTAKATANDGSGIYGTLTITISSSGCVNETFITSTGIVTDNSGSSDYGNNMTCAKLIQPSGGGPIVLQFTEFTTESGYDYVRVYDGATTSAALLGSFSGSSLPPVLTSGGGSMLITFTTDNNITAAGWSAYYISNQVIPVTGITVTGETGTSVITTDKGTLQLSAAVLPSNATDKTVTWSITNGTGQATISSTGLVTAVANGTVTAKATANDGSGVSGSLVIIISNQIVPVTGITVTGETGTSAITTDNGTLQLDAAVLPSDATDKAVTWSITNGTGQAIISSTGLVTAVANGYVTAKATANDGSGVYGTLVIIISNQAVPVTGISVTGAGGTSTITTDNGTLQLSAAVSPSDATNKTVTWTITNGTGQATISSTGLVTATADGTVTAKATANDGSGVTGTLTITISNQIIPVTGITITGAGGATLITVIGGKLQLSATISPANATDKTVTWSVVNGTGQASVSTSGLVTAAEDGTVTVRATANDGSGVYGILVITISSQTIPVSSIAVSSSGGTNTITTDGGTLQLSATVSPVDATNKTFTWSIENGTGQATINSSGLITAVANGIVIARATANDGSGVSGIFNITISNQFVPVKSITVTGADGLSTITNNNGTLQLNASVSPSNATDKTITWSIENGTGQATINSSGLVTAEANGTVTARATANDRSGTYGTLTITISNQIIPVTGITVTGANDIAAITTNNGTLQLNAAVSPSNASDKTVTWSINQGSDLATINSSGLVTAIANGIVTARATANDGTGISGSLVITISNQSILAKSINIASDDGIVVITNLGDTLQLFAQILPVDATDTTVTWSVINVSGEANISATGLVTAVTNGLVIVTAAANDGSGLTDSLKITIDEDIVLVKSIIVAPSDIFIPVIKEKKGTLQMEAEIIPTDASVYSIEWMVENHTGAATVNDSGLVTAVADGSVKVIAKARDGSNKSGFCMVAITNQNNVTGIGESENTPFHVVRYMDKLRIYSIDKNPDFNYYSLHSIQGVLLQRKEITDDIIEIDVSSYPAGIYIISLSNDQQAFPLKVAIH